MKPATAKGIFSAVGADLVVALVFRVGADLADLGLLATALDQVATDSYLYQMRSVGVKILKNKLSEYLRLAAGGETVLVTDRDRVVAELIPPREGRSVPIADAFLAEAVRQGWLTAPVMRDDRPPPRLPVASAAQLLSELADDRADR